MCLLILAKTNKFTEKYVKIHSIEQCVDVILGSIAFMLNKKNKVVPEGASERGSRTVAKEKLFFHILHFIEESDGVEFFDIATSTPIQTLEDLWAILYIHWELIPSEYL